MFSVAFISPLQGEEISFYYDPGVALVELAYPWLPSVTLSA
jgi:hypothetical protein